MKKNVESSMILVALNETFTYLCPQFDEDRLSDIKKILLSLSGLSEFDFRANKDKRYSYESIQELLSTINEKQSIRKAKGVYYTPSDVVRFILDNSIKSIYGKLGTNGLHVMDLNGIPYKSFCETKKVFDPTCGAGEFLLAALETKFDLIDNHTDNVTNGMIIKTVRTIYGNDINVDSTTITKLRLFLCVLNRYGFKRCLSVESVLNGNFTNFDFISSVPKIEQHFDLIIGNPPFVEDSKSELKLDRKYGNIYANVLINATALLNENGSLGFVLPLSYISTPRMGKIRDDLFSCISEQYILSFSDRPDCLFKSVHQKLCILIGRKRKCDKRVFTGNYQYWYKEERDTLFDNTVAVKNPFFEEEFIPKLGTSTDLSIYKKIARQHTYHSLSTFATRGGNKVFVNMRAAFWIKAFLNEHDGAEYKSFSFDDKGKADYFHCLMNSSLFWWYWTCVSDCWHITNKELQRFFLPEVTDYSKVSELATALENALENTKVYVGTKQIDYEYKHKSCVEEIHAIDDYINNLYGLTPAENVYIKNFAYRYRVSGGTE